MSLSWQWIVLGVAATMTATVTTIWIMDEFFDDSDGPGGNSSGGGGGGNSSGDEFDLDGDFSDGECPPSGCNDA